MRIINAISYMGTDITCWDGAMIKTVIIDGTSYTARLPAPEIKLNGDTLTITPTESYSEQYAIYADGKQVFVSAAGNVNLLEHITKYGEYNITCKTLAGATGFADSKSSAAVSWTRKAIKVTLVCTCDGAVVSRKTYVYPQNTTYTIVCPLCDVTEDGTRNVYAPQTDTVTGTTGSTDVNITVQYNIAFSVTAGTLSVYRVDTATQYITTLTLGD